MVGVPFASRFFVVVIFTRGMISMVKIFVCTRCWVKSTFLILRVLVSRIIL